MIIKIHLIHLLGKVSNILNHWSNSKSLKSFKNIERIMKKFQNVSIIDHLLLQKAGCHSCDFLNPDASLIARLRIYWNTLYNKIHHRCFNHFPPFVMSFSWKKSISFAISSFVLQLLYQLFSVCDMQHTLPKLGILWVHMCFFSF